jgi:aminocarboxymuconate-semialdehyde decarboxylase
MKIDIFNHFIPDAYYRRVQVLAPDNMALKAFKHLPQLWDLDERLRLLDEFDGYQQVICLANPPLEYLREATDTAELARLANDELAETCRRHPDHFPSFIASLPMDQPDEALHEADRAVGDLGACGVQVFTNINGRPLSEPQYRPLFERMAEHDLPVWVHPMRTPASPDYATEQKSEDDIWFIFGWPYETSACMMRLIFSGLFDALPKLKIITHHMGGMIPFFAEKISLGFLQIFKGTPDRNILAEQAGLARQPLDYFHMLYADTAINGSIPATECGHAFFGTERCLFATDAPFDAERGRGLIRRTIEAVEALDISDEDRVAIFAGNAKRLLRLA